MRFRCGELRVVNVDTMYASVSSRPFDHAYVLVRGTVFVVFDEVLNEHWVTFARVLCGTLVLYVPAGIVSAYTKRVAK